MNVSLAAAACRFVSLSQTQLNNSFFSFPFFYQLYADEEIAQLALSLARSAACLTFIL